MQNEENTKKEPITQEEKGLFASIWGGITSFFTWLKNLFFGDDDEKNKEDKEDEQINDTENEKKAMIPQFHEMEKMISEMKYKKNNDNEIVQKINEDFWESGSNIEMQSRLNPNNLEKQINAIKGEKTLYEEALQKAKEAEKEDPFKYDKKSLLNEGNTPQNVEKFLQEQNYAGR